VLNKLPIPEPALENRFLATTDLTGRGVITVKYINRIASSILGLAALGVAGLSSAQQLEEIIVTATHREQNIQDVPLAVTALGGAQLEAAGIFDATTIALNVPGMAYAEFAPGQALISIRGIATTDDGAGLDNSTALFLDGVYIGRMAGINFDMFDLDRIEVLKGPQGTLFGRNAVAGAINVVTTKPTDEFTAKVALTAGNEGILRYQGLISGPFSENWSGKLVVNHREHDGFVRNTHLDKDETTHPSVGNCAWSQMHPNGFCQPIRWKMTVMPWDVRQLQTETLITSARPLIWVLARPARMHHRRTDLQIAKDRASVCMVISKSAPVS